MSGYYADISEWQDSAIDWQAYKKWSSQWDGVSRVALRSSYGTGYTDKHYHAYRQGAEQAGIDVIMHYHYGYPQFNSAINEANWQKQVVGTLRASDLLMLDLEEQVSQATSEWCYEWLKQQEQNYTKTPVLYASESYVLARLQDVRLAHYPLVLARWGLSEMPACPRPWGAYVALQYTNKASVPGIIGVVDCNMWLEDKKEST